MNVKFYYVVRRQPLDWSDDAVLSYHSSLSVAKDEYKTAKRQNIWEAVWIEICSFDPDTCVSDVYAHSDGYWVVDGVIGPIEYPTTKEKATKQYLLECMKQFSQKGGYRT